ncbi:monocarboxylate transporter 5-like [Ylistrum balloti]|uniref:monocarboxylate transporter 5-like n=1 Tax=Ylistrum balloti TaxID=509963 RepID=UPI002905AA67|nr:monocarboxylate transporter 5-like [Ylistrum balloti]
MPTDTCDSRIPVDRGWAWMVLAGSFMISTINTGTEKSYGIFFIEFLRMFKGTVFMTVMINTVLNVVYCFTAASVLLIGFKRLSIRKSVFLGIILSAIGYGISSLATSLEFLIVSQSILIGVSIAFYNPPIYILLEEYFDKRKGLANALFLSANALGGMIMPPLYRYVFDEYGLRGGLIITSGIILNSLVAAALLRPTEFYTKKASQKSPNVNGNVSDNFSVRKRKHSETNSSQYHEPDTQHSLLTETETTQTDDINDSVDKTSQSSIYRYVSNGDIVSVSLTNLRDTIDQQDVETNKGDKFTCGHCQVTCSKKVDCYLMTNILFLLFLAIYCFGNVAIMCAHIYLPTYAEDIGIGDSQIALIVSVTCMSDFVGRIIAGHLADRPWISAQQIIILSQVVVGVILQFTVYYTSFWRLLVFVVLFGFTGGMIVALFPPMLIEIVGKKRYRSAMAVFIICICLFEGTALPVLGYFRDVTNTYHFTFHVMGASSFIAVVLLIIFDIISRKQARKKKESDTNTGTNLSP